MVSEGKKQLKEGQRRVCPFLLPCLAMTVAACVSGQTPVGEVGAGPSFQRALLGRV